MKSLLLTVAALATTSSCLAAPSAMPEPEAVVRVPDAATATPLRIPALYTPEIPVSLPRDSLPTSNTPQPLRVRCIHRRSHVGGAALRINKVAVTIASPA